MYSSLILIYIHVRILKVKRNERAYSLWTYIVLLTITVVKTLKKDDVYAGFTFRPGVQTSFNPQMDGNCQFSAVANLLQTELNTAVSANDLRQRVVNFLSAEPRLADDTLLDLAHFVEGADVHGYLVRMGSHHTFGDHLTLLGMACLFQVQFIILSSLGESGTRIVSPCTTSNFVANLPVLLLGHFAETEAVIGEHYVSLQAENNEVLQGIIHSLTSQNLPSNTAMPTGSTSQPKSVIKESEAVSSQSPCKSSPQTVPGLSMSSAAKPSWPDVPHQPHNITCIPPQELGSKVLRFQKHWFQEFPWLHFDASVNGVLCFICGSASRQGLATLAKCKKDSFTNTGFRNWKNAREKFGKHQNTTAHHLAVNDLQAQKQSTVTAQISSKARGDQLLAQNALLCIISSVRYLAQQGLALRGKEGDDGNLIQLLELRASDNGDIQQWLKKKTTFTNPQLQNEMLEIFSHAILRRLCEDINRSIQFGIVVDGTQDIQGNEQESICVRYVTEDLEVKEDFLGLYQVATTSGIAIASMLQDALTRLQLPIQHLRAQTYDGAGNMAGKYKGCQAELKRIQPLATYVHCGAHVSHLVTSKCVQVAPFIRDALDLVQELGNLYKSSGKFKNLYLNVHSDDADSPSPSRLKPICPTRWLTRSSAVMSVLSNYQDILVALEEAAAEFGSSTASRANGLHSRFSSGVTLIGLLAIQPILQCLEAFNRGLQGSSVTVSGMMEVANVTRSVLSSLRNDERFGEIFQSAQSRINEFDLTPLALPRRRKIPRRLDDGSAANTSPGTPEDLFRVQFFQVIDSALMHLDEEFQSTDLVKYNMLAAALISGNLDSSVVDSYPELSPFLPQELTFFHSKFSGNTVEDFRLCFKNMAPEVRSMFPQVERLLRLCLTSPASSCSAERSFSALRRLKTWLRSTMTQRRLNHVMICHVHRDLLMHLNCRDLARAFVNNNNDTRKPIFGEL